MSKFINKKEQVFDLKLTSYGHYLFAIGGFKPTYYAFFDDNITYDRRYFGVTETSASMEPQNNIHRRIKEETQYLESQVLFESVENFMVGGGSDEPIEGRTADGTSFKTDITATKMKPRKDIFNYNVAIGDARLDGETQRAPAWKIVTLQGDIVSSYLKYKPLGYYPHGAIDPAADHPGAPIPQINIELNYVKKIVDEQLVIEQILDPNSIRDTEAYTPAFGDNRVVQLTSDDAMVYVEEVNTDVLTENYDIQVFLVTSSIKPVGIWDEASGESNPEDRTVGDILLRKYFQKEIPQVQGGFMLSENPVEIAQGSLTTGSVEYYFDLLVDSSVDEALACKGSEIYNKQSYYVDIDYDIYGQATEPEICLD
jgi:hypothetical protein